MVDDINCLVWYGTGGLPRGMDSGELAKWVSNASFATLTLIYSFTQLLDLASQFSTLAGVTLRVGQLLQVSSISCRAFCQQSMILPQSGEMTGVPIVRLLGLPYHISAEAYHALSYNSSLTNWSSLPLRSSRHSNNTSFEWYVCSSGVSATQ